MGIFNIFKRSSSHVSIQEGQLWTYHGLPGNESSTLTILKIEEEANRQIIHICVDRIYNSQSEREISVGHLPFDRKILTDCLKEKIGEVSPLPDFLEGYNNWKQQNGGAWNIPLRSVLEILSK